MITDALLSFLLGVVNALLSFLPSNEPPAWLLSGTGFVSTVFGYAGLMGAWFPVTLVRNVVVGVLVMYLVGFGIKLVRIVVSFATLGGGSAG